MHIGDNEKSDYLAAREAGLKTILIDRCQSVYKEKYYKDVINSLSDVLEKVEL